MNITFPSVNTSYRSTVSAQQKTMPRKEKVKGDYDTVNIRRPRVSDDDTFARMLARRTASQLNGASASSEKVAELRSKVASGNYTPDAQRIAGRMLGLG